MTGTGGQLAQSLAERALLHDGVELVVCGRPQLDLEIPGSAKSAIAAFAPDVVINAAAYTAVDQAEDEPERAFRINGDGAGEVAAAAAAAGAAVIQLSTDYVFDGRSSEPYREDATVNPLGVYGRSKLAGEEQARAANPRHAIVRTAWVYSPFGRNFVRSIMAAAGVRDVLTVVDDQRGSPTSALDLADGLLAMAATGAGWGETFHLAGRGQASWCEFAREIMAQCAVRGLPHVPVEPIRSEDWPTRAARPRNSVLDSGKFERTFGFAMPDWRISARAVVERLAREQAAPAA
ncbi:dTDP-4-dehydrorhamnose reductase [Sphingomonas sp.]|uniref:dTDP-4-dehydrorhamnose reductase n=1 Tax=Sphingomonas sp. TaxID=28214 RepID=UPI0038A10D0E